jgi:hypothetical protein
MRSNVLGGREAIFAALDRLDADAEALGQLPFDGRTQRRIPVMMLVPEERA